MKANHNRFKWNSEKASKLNLSQTRMTPGHGGEISELKGKLLGEYGMEFATLPPMLLARAMSEADALASTTTFPQLFLPGLAEEKMRSLGKWEERQNEVRRPIIWFAE
jgi:hypothetical protein